MVTAYLISYVVHSGYINHLVSIIVMTSLTNTLQNKCPIQQRVSGTVAIDIKLQPSFHFDSSQFLPLYHDIPRIYYSCYYKLHYY